MAEKIGCGRNMYYLIESGKRDGSMKIWNTLKEVFDVPDEKIGGLMRNES